MPNTQIFYYEHHLRNLALMLIILVNIRDRENTIYMPRKHFNALIV